MNLNGLRIVSGLMLCSTVSMYAGESLKDAVGKYGKLSGKQSFPEVKLRGYGKISGESAVYSRKGKKDLSLLEIDCESPEIAALVQAKYLSDLQSLGEVKKIQITIDRRQVQGYNAADQGYIACARKNNKVMIVAAVDENELADILKQTSGLEFSSNARIPMYLDGWDQYAFRFYYRPGAMPNDKKKRENYNVIDEFEFAKKNDHCGFVFWAGQNQLDFAGGLNHDLLWDWAARASERRKLPMVINLTSSPALWMLNKYRNQTIMKMPQYCGTYHKVADPYFGGMGTISWAASSAKDAELALLQKIVKKYSKIPTTIDYLEPHGELDHGAYNIFLEYGPEADKSYRGFLQRKYGTTAKLSERWYGSADKIKSWNDVRIPEVASFLGWNKNAVDLTGKWHISYFNGKASDDWFKMDFDDSKWPVVEAPGHDRTMFLKQKPAVYRRTFELDPDWLKKHPKVWLYVWDLNYGKHLKEKIAAYVNGSKAGEDLTRHATPHWGAFEVDKLLKPGKNQVSLELTQGYLAYRVYLSPDAPKQYPDLGKLRNAQWVDFTDWRTYTRVSSLERGIEMIRQVDPNRPIILMAPNGYVGELKPICEQYGARFHNTGSMGGWWNDYLPSLMRSSGLPFTLEPGGPAKDLPAFKKMMGHYFTQGVNAIHYFIHVGDIMWDDRIRAHFEKILPMLKALGKIHQPQAQIAYLHSSRVGKLTSYPWGKDPNTNLQSGYVPWRLSNNFISKYMFDAVTEGDFARGNAKPYKLIYDSNTSVMTPEVVEDITKWVKDGGIFVTFVQTGRHTPEEKDAWPINKLTGYEVVVISKYEPDGSPVKHMNAVYAPGQPIFDENRLKLTHGNGLYLKKVDPDAQNLIMWKDGTVAAGLRKLGKGYVITLGIKFCRGVIWHSGLDRTIEMFDQIFKWAKCKPLPAGVDNDKIMLKQYVSNNGLFNVWVLWNQDRKKEITATLTFDNAPEYYVNVETGKLTPLKANVIKNLKFPALETMMFLTPKDQLLTSADAWFELQRNWWKGTKSPAHKSLPELKTPNTMDLTEEWRVKPLDPKLLTDDTEYAKPDFDDSGWTVMRNSCWIYPEELNTRHAVFRREFTVPTGWNNGRIYLWIRKWTSQTVSGRMRVWLDGKVIKVLHPPHHGIDGMPLDLKPGSKHLLTLEVDGQGVLPGLQGNSFLSYIPNPDAKIDLSGMWTPSKDALTYEKPVQLPGKWNAFMAKRKIMIPAEYKNDKVYFEMESSSQIIGVLVNGHWIRRHHHRIGGLTHINITPWVKFGQENELEIVSWLGKSRGEVKQIELYFYQ